MASVKIKIQIEAPGGVAHVNIIQSQNDNIWELRHPQTETTVEIPDGESRYAFVNVLAIVGTKFTLFKDDEPILEEETDNQNAFGGYAIIHA